MLRQAIHTPSRAISSSLRLAGQRALSKPQFYRAAPLSSSVRATQLTTPRWYSAGTEPKAATEQSSSEGTTSTESESAPESQQTPEAPSPEAELKTQLEAKEDEVRDWKDKYLRSVADFRNLQERTQRDMKAARDFAIQKFAKDLVDSVDNLDRALATVPEEKLKAEKTEQNQDLINLHEGLRMTETILMQTLAKHGLERFDPAGEPFNPNEHEATFMAPAADKEDNTVFYVQQKGFKLNGRVLRAAKVGVVKNK